MFNFKKNNNDDDQQNQNLNPNPNLPPQTPVQNPPVTNQVQDDPNLPLTSPPNLDDFDPPTPVFDLPQDSTPNINPVSTLTPQLEEAQTIITDAPAPATPVTETPISQPVPNIPDLDSQLKNLDNTQVPTTNSEDDEGEDIMSDISNFQEDFNTKYDSLAEKIRQFLNRKIEEDKKVGTSSTQNVISNPDEKMEVLESEPASKINKELNMQKNEAPQMSSNLAQDEINQRQEQLNPNDKKTESFQDLVLENQDGQIKNPIQTSQLNPTDLPTNPGALK